jgi:hypothetical protein
MWEAFEVIEQLRREKEELAAKLNVLRLLAFKSKSEKGVRIVTFSSRGGL